MILRKAHHEDSCLVAELRIEAEVVAAAFLARYSGRTLDAYRHDLLTFFRWATEVDVGVLEASRPHIELYRATLEERGLFTSERFDHANAALGLIPLTEMDTQ
jgi:site-specific recombinase XerD